MLFLAGDIGGTKALLQLIAFRPETSERTLLGQNRYLCQDFDSLESIIQTFLSSLNLSSSFIESACFGLPGPVNGRIVQLTNLPWIVDADQIEQACSIRKVSFINDFHAAALGVPALEPDQVLPLYMPPLQEQGAQCKISNHFLVIGAGTGLGVSPVFYDGVHVHPVASEGGHFDFAPISQTQQLLLTWLWQQYEHVSYERVLSGPGLETLYCFFELFDCPTTYSLDDSQNLKKNRLENTQNNQVGLFIAQSLKQSGYPTTPTAAEIYRAAELNDPIAVKALTEFVTIYGAFVGASALFWGASQGVYLAGGIAIKIFDWIRKPYFHQAYIEKGRMSKIVESRPVYLVSDDTLGLRGAMQHNLTD
ncbi:glucokinase [Thiomicrorhabdus sp. ZW0627]|uniref:glucokinase n=1 Tax=Thiomicrorhabdus sp. ZW0627 TaxID=3039774 RepID=UPI0024366236|nr:glucokinase [Thiomicrorhabdus sp. ZW0627]MDG6773635.1 glucokinase [Thiomicrorhabdus sp. ZW0627]